VSKLNYAACKYDPDILLKRKGANWPNVFDVQVAWPRRLVLRFLPLRGSGSSAFVVGLNGKLLMQCA